MDNALELRAWADNDDDPERATMMRLAADEIGNLRAKLVALRCFAGTLAVHVEGHFALPTKDSESICKKWAETVKSENA